MVFRTGSLAGMLGMFRWKSWLSYLLGAYIWCEGFILCYLPCVFGHLLMVCGRFWLERMGAMTVLGTGTGSHSRSLLL
ncbi:hypothetical protein Sjap_004330 [Stephania japonica]|uniref:Uncharacterized protein n=1 Tax=Stephania japonica TaxID=461633 RepID=A0AAP0PHR2_9MAGN